MDKYSNRFIRVGYTESSVMLNGEGEPSPSVEYIQQH